MAISQLDTAVCDADAEDLLGVLLAERRVCDRTSAQQQRVLTHARLLCRKLIEARLYQFTKCLPDLGHLEITLVALQIGGQIDIDESLRRFPAAQLFKESIEFFAHGVLIRLHPHLVVVHSDQKRPEVVICDRRCNAVVGSGFTRHSTTRQISRHRFLAIRRAAGITDDFRQFLALLRKRGRSHPLQDLRVLTLIIRANATIVRVVIL